MLFLMIKGVITGQTKVLSANLMVCRVKATLASTGALSLHPLAHESQAWFTPSTRDVCDNCRHAGLS